MKVNQFEISLQKKKKIQRIIYKRQKPGSKTDVSHENKFTKHSHIQS
jgi:hypothetical protein